MSSWPKSRTAESRSTSLRSGPVQLGLFDVVQHIGTGGMGEVWLGHHRQQDVAVAIKVLSEGYADNEDFLDAFRAEVQAVARLDHPAVVKVFDHGIIPAETADASGGVLLEGRPYLVMEHASGGTLQSHGPPRNWSALRDTLLTILDALAHAHARGVVHRDVKPANVLVCAPEDSRPGLKLSDFGLAAAGERLRAERLMGTPAYMAPEQCDGRWRDHGPWTDLYAFGCLAYALASGRLPFDDTNPMQIVLQQFADDPPPLKPLVSVPTGFEAWLHRLLEKSPSDRFRWAADVRTALLDLGEPDEDASPGGDTTPRGERRLKSGATDPGWNVTVLPRPHGADPPRVEPSSGSLSAFDSAEATSRQVTQVSALPMGLTSPPTVPQSWPAPDEGRKHAQKLEDARHLLGVGLGLYGLRTIPLVGREEQQQQIWSALTDVHETGESRAVVILGEPGVGKSRLAESVTQRAHEMGAAQVMHGTHSATVGSPGEGVPRMLRDFLRCNGLDRRELSKRLDTLYGTAGDLDIDALTELLSPASARDLVLGARAIRFANPEERYATARQLLEHLCEERPIVVWLDDVQWGLDTLGFVNHVLELDAAATLPVLFVLTARADSLTSQPLEHAALDEVLAHERSERIELDVLSDSQHRALVGALLGLEGELVEHVAQRTSGNPLFAVQLVGDWVSRGVLEPGSRGFGLKDGAQAFIPDDIHDLWRLRLDRILDDERDDAEQALELAAALGVDVQTREWVAVCALARLEASPGLLEKLYDAGLARRRPDGWSFAHNMFRESLERTARENRRWSRHNRLCAEMIGALYGEDQRGRAERMGRHLLVTSKLRRAIELLLRGARERFEVSEYRVALALLDKRDRAMKRLRIGASDPRWARGWLVRSDTLRVLGHYDEALEWARRAESSLRASDGGDDGLANALLALAHAHKEQHAFEDASAAYREALELFERIDDSRGRADCLWGMGVLALATGDLDEAATLIERTRKLSEAAGYKLREADANYQLGGLAKRRGDLDAAETYVESARGAFENAGSRAGVANCLNGLGELLRARAQPRAAEERYREALALHTALGTSGVTCRINLGLTLLELERYAEAEQVLSSVERSLERLGVRALAGVVSVALLGCHAHAGNWDAFEASLESADARLGELVDPDVAWAARLGGELALDSDEVAMGRRALELARTQWERLEDAEQVRVIDEVLSSASD